MTSRCGSADVLEALGVPIGLPPADAAGCLRATGFLFLLATGLHPAMRGIAPVRRALPFRTIFNLVGPLSNPAGAAAQVVGVYAESRIPVVAEALRLLGTRHAWVVHGRVPNAAGLDELTVTGESLWAEVLGDVTRTGSLEPEALHLRRCELTKLKGGADARENASLIEAVLRGEDRGARRSITLLNAASALVVSGLSATLADGFARAQEALDRGAAFTVLERLRSFRPSLV